MSESSNDRRVLKTKLLIRDALTELMEEKSFDSITVRDLTQKAFINRGTFYLHYRDKYDLLEQSEDEIINEIKILTQDVNPREAVVYTRQDEPFPIILKLFEYFQENARFMKVMLGPNGPSSFQEKLKDIMQKTFAEKIFKVISKEDLLVPMDVLMTYISSAHLGVLKAWVESGMEKPPREMVLILAKISLLGPGHVGGLNNAKSAGTISFPSKQ